ncbi:MAG: ATP-dependent DNA helicase RecG [Synergistaceae bacterium]|nr:ATP-dependent DNA helicase RecG [Synergistaceae bacterium]
MSSLRGVGRARERLLEILGIVSVSDLLYHIPARYEDRRRVTPIGQLEDGRVSAVKGRVAGLKINPTRKHNLNVATFDARDGTGVIRVALFGGPRSFMRVKENSIIYLYGTPSFSDRGFLEFVSPEYAAFGTENEVPQWLCLWPIYPTTRGLPRSWLANLIKSCATSPELILDDPLPAAILEKYSFMPLKHAFERIHAPQTHEDITRATERLVYQEFYEYQRGIIAQIAATSRLTAKSTSSGKELQDMFIASLPFQFTKSQRRALEDITSDMDGQIPMNRLLIGDVGSGKTAVAAAAAARCAGAGYQTAILAPTTILADQFFDFVEKHFAPLGKQVAKITGNTPRVSRDELIWRLRDGEIDILVGTHAMLSETVAFRSMGLLVIDEQQRFGVLQRDKIASGNRGTHLLMTTATPIPRTLRMALYGDIACTEMEARPDKGKIITKMTSDNHIGELYAFLSERVRQTGDKCYWVCPLIGSDDGDAESSVAARAKDLKTHMNDIPVEVLTGEMPAREKAGTMERFKSSGGILVSTTVIEVGVDVRGANIIVIEKASAYGLSQLHQLRGRVGRGSRKGICVLLDTSANLKGSARLSVLLNCDDGFKIAEEDLRLRGAGEYLGVRQYGDENFKVADIARDEKWFSAAREDAAEIQKNAE